MLVAALAAILVLPGASPARVAGAIVQITSGPSGETTATSATFSWSLAPGRTTSTQCVLDRLIETCTSPKSYAGLTVGAHQFTVRAYYGSTEVDRDVRSWTVVAPVRSPPPPTTPAPPPPTVAGPVAKLQIGPGSGSPPVTGALVLLDASASTGAVRYRFDLDGNGTYETDCGSNPRAGIVFAAPGGHPVGVETVSASGVSAVAEGSAQVAGGGHELPAGVSSALATGTTVGGCVSADDLAATVAAYNCPAMVLLGVAELVMPADAPSGACFKRTGVGTGQEYVAPAGQAVLVDGLRVQPDPGASVTLRTAKPRVLVAGGSAKLGVRRDPHVVLDSGSMQIDWDVSRAGTVASPRVGGVALGMKVPDQQVPLVLTAAAQARLDVHVTLFWSVFDGLASHSGLSLLVDNGLEPVSGAYTVAFDYVPLGVLALRNVELTYARQGSSDVWDGGLTLVLPPDLQLSGHFRMQDGSVKEVSAGLDVDPGLGPIGCCVYATHLAVSYGSSLTGAVRFTAGPEIAGHSLAALDGSLTIDPGSFLATAKGTLSVVGISLADASAVFAPTYFDFSGSVHQDFLGVFSVDAKISADLGTNGRWFGIGAGNACLDVIGCVSAAVGASNSGIAACGGVSTPLGDLSAGAVYHWGGSAGVFTGCSVGKLKSEVGALRAVVGARSGVAGPVSVRLAPGLTVALFKVTGATAAPAVVLKGPRGRTITTPDPVDSKLDRANGSLVTQVAGEKATYLEVASPPGGTWTVTALPGSPAILSVAEADGLPKRVAIGSVTGKGGERLLHYRISAPDGVAVSFAEQGAAVDHTLGTATKPKGTLRFSPADGPAGTRTIVAVVTSQGLPVRSETVARFRPAGPLVLPAPRLRAVRSGGGLVLRWRPVPGARGYHARVAVGDGRDLYLTAKRSPLRVPRVSGLLPATVSLTAFGSSLLDGLPGRARVAPLASISVAGRPTAASLLLAGALRVRCLAAGDGVCTASVAAGSRVVARGSARAHYGRAVTFRVRLTTAGRTILHARSSGFLRLTADVPGAGKRVVRVRLRR